MVQIVPADTDAEYLQVRELFAELSAWDMAQVGEMGLDAQQVLDFYYASGEEELPGVYAPPEGRMILAAHSGRGVGCAAFHRMTAEICEMKRMYVRPEFRKRRIGRKLTEILIIAAREAGYRVMRLETTTFMDKAIAMYSTLGFRLCPPYYVIPESFRSITVFMALDLLEVK